MKLTSAGQTIEQYKSLHQKIIGHPGQNIFDFDQDKISEYPEFLLRTLVVRDNLGGHNQGTVFLHIFRTNFPEGNNNNKGMIYIVPPNGKIPGIGGSEFLRRVNQTAKNIGQIVNQYNRMDIADELNIVRVCLFSGQEYKHPSILKIEVAKNILTGLIESTKVAITYQFAYDQDVFKKAARQLNILHS